jgi:hypothetical protein
MHNRIMCSALASTLLFASFTRADTIKDFVITQKTTNAADDLRVSFNNVGLVPGSAVIKDNMGNVIGKFNTSAVTPAGSSTILYTNPVDNMGKAISVFQNYTTTITVQSKGTGATKAGFNWAKGASSYSMGNTNLQNSVGQLSPDIDLNQNQNTNAAFVSIGDSGDDFLFLTDIEVWTGLTAAQADMLDANGNFDSSLLPTTPNFTLTSLNLTPGQAQTPIIPIGLYPNDGSYVVALYDLAAGPDSNVADAINLGEGVLSTNQPVPTPEPPSLWLFGFGVVMCGVHRLGQLWREKVGNSPAGSLS